GQRPLRRHTGGACRAGMAGDPGRPPGTARNRHESADRLRRWHLVGHRDSLGTAIGIPLTAVEPRIAAAIFGGGFVVHRALIEAARRITVPVQFLLPWDD